MASPRNEPVPNIPFFYPSVPQPPGSALQLSSSTPTLFKPITIRGQTYQNRIFVAPMCSYSCAPSGPQIGALTSFHIATLGHYAIKGSSLVFIEASAVSPEGRISPNDSGIWQDEQIEGIRKVADQVHAAGSKLGIQLAHAGRKASTVAPWLGRERGKSIVAGEDVHGWPNGVVGPSPIAWSSEGYAKPNELSEEGIKGIVKAFADAAKRAVAAGVDVIEIHGAHGYLLCSFNSPISNQRTDKYGGSFENRTRICVEVIKAVREVIPADMPLFYRITSTEWMDESEEAKTLGSWDVAQSIQFAKQLPSLGVDLLDVSSGGNHEHQRIQPHLTYQIEIAGQIRKELKQASLPLLIGAVGMITGAEQARDIVQLQKGQYIAEPGTNGDVNFEGSTKAEAEQARDLVQGDDSVADVILVARQFMREPEWVLRVAWRLGVEVQWPIQYGRGKFLKGSVI
ncbi:putative NADH oxidase [Rhizodiscina lignyota]|uniref:NADH oxidase n=1 Tax=Rhizodiscina lignyota TaxID=1504668 RepID=A0A9P4IIK3_9PEZI|nr:putative NADH oxidase [Rhizodiscina lignyota]